MLYFGKIRCIILLNLEKEGKILTVNKDRDEKVLEIIDIEADEMTDYEGLAMCTSIGDD